MPARNLVSWLSGKLLPLLPTDKLKCTKFDFGWGSAPDPAGGNLQRSPRLLAGFKGRTSKGRTGRKGKGDGNGKGGENHTGNFPLHFETRTSENMRHIHLLATWPQKRRYEYTACTPLRGSKPPSTFTTDIQKQNCIYSIPSCSIIFV